MRDSRGTLSLDGGGIAISAGRFLESLEGSGGLPGAAGMLGDGVRRDVWYILFLSETSDE